MTDERYRHKILRDTARLQSVEQHERVAILLTHRRNGRPRKVTTKDEESALIAIGDFIVQNGEHPDKLRMAANLRQYDWVVAGCPR